MIPNVEQGHIHLLGICGTAMASLAGLLTEKGIRVSGSDENIYPPMSDVLSQLDVTVSTPYHPDNVPDDCKIVVVGNALSRGNVELEAVLERGIPYVSMPALMKEMYLRERSPVVVAGTHGKTTTSSLIAWLLENAGMQPGFLIGGVPLNFGVSYRIGVGAPFIIEGDEYDTAYFDKGPKFMHYLPEIAVVGNVEFDHADIYRDITDIEKNFRYFVNLVPKSGLLVLGKDNELAASLAKSAHCSVNSFGLLEGADWSLEVLDVDDQGTSFRVKAFGNDLFEVCAPFWGRAALWNVLAACAAVKPFGLSSEQISNGLATFKGVRRRFEVVGEVNGVTVIDDFAHHPTAITETLLSVKSRFQGNKIWCVFEPRSFTSRSRIFQDELVQALRQADEVVISEVFSSERLDVDEELSEEQLVDDLGAIGTEAKFLCGQDSITQHLVQNVLPGDVVLLMSNGSFGGLPRKIFNAFKNVT